MVLGYWGSLILNPFWLVNAVPTHVLIFNTLEKHLKQVNYISNNTISNNTITTQTPK